MDEILTAKDIDEILASDFEGSTTNTTTPEEKTRFFDWKLKSENTKSFKTKLFKNFKQFYQDFSLSFYKLTEKKLELAIYGINEYNSLTDLSNMISHYGSDFYLRKIKLEKEEFIEYVSPSFVNDVLIQCNNGNNQNFIKKTLANHFIFRPMERIFAQNSQAKIISEDNKLKNPQHIPYTDPIATFDSFENTINLLPEDGKNLLSVEFECTCDGKSLLFFIAGKKEAWLKYLGEENCPDKFITSEDFINHNVYSIFTELNLSENTIKNMKSGDTFFTNSYNNKVPLISKGKMIAEGDIFLDENNISGFFVRNPIPTEQQEDYYENNENNIFVVLGSAYYAYYIEETLQNNIKENLKIKLNTEISGFFPVVYKNKIIAHASIINKGCTVIKIAKVEENPIPFIN